MGIKGCVAGMVLAGGCIGMRERRRRGNVAVTGVVNCNYEDERVRTRYSFAKSCDTRTKKLQNSTDHFEN